jgi:CHAT domain-containing protein
VLLAQPADGRHRPRIWWCPTGQFAHLPIHAAGGNGHWCSDYVVSSYTPTLGVLLSARTELTLSKKQDVKALVAAVPRSDIPEWCELKSTHEEARVVRQVLPEGTLIELPDADDVLSAEGRGMTTATLLEKLPGATILHLACHGRQDAKNAVQSGFVMRDGVLTIERLMPTPLPHAFMAFLSACETAKGDKVRRTACAWC